MNEKRVNDEVQIPWYHVTGFSVLSMFKSLVGVATIIVTIMSLITSWLVSVYATKSVEEMMQAALLLAGLFVSMLFIAIILTGLTVIMGLVPSSKGCMTVCALFISAILVTLLPLTSQVTVEKYAKLSYIGLLVWVISLLLHVWYSRYLSRNYWSAWQVNHIRTATVTTNQLIGKLSTGTAYIVDKYDEEATERFATKMVDDTIQETEETEEAEAEADVADAQDAQVLNTNDLSYPYPGIVYGPKEYDETTTLRYPLSATIDDDALLGPVDTFQFIIHEPIVTRRVVKRTKHGLKQEEIVIISNVGPLMLGMSVDDE